MFLCLPRDSLSFGRVLLHGGRKRDCSSLCGCSPELEGSKHACILGSSEVDFPPPLLLEMSLIIKLLWAHCKKDIELRTERNKYDRLPAPHPASVSASHPSDNYLFRFQTHTHTHTYILCHAHQLVFWVYKNVLDIFLHQNVNSSTSHFSFFLFAIIIVQVYGRTCGNSEKYIKKENRKSASILKFHYPKIMINIEENT